MSPSSHEINGPRPTPLKIHKDPHQIQKQSFSSSTTSTITTTSNHHQRHQRPVIIYTHSPKVIHTQARDFMALVQKLTGLTRSPTDKKNHDKGDDYKPTVGPARPVQNFSGVQQSPSSPSYHDHQDDLGLGFDNYLSDIPLYTPNSASEFFLLPSNVKGEGIL